MMIYSNGEIVVDSRDVVGDRMDKHLSDFRLSRDESFDQPQGMNCERDHVCLSVLSAACVEVFGGSVRFACHCDSNITPNNVG
jgi:hypothetical protein